MRRQITTRIDAACSGSGRARAGAFLRLGFCNTLAICLLPQPATALQICANEAEPPYTYVDAQGRMAGSSIERVRAALERLHIAVEFKPLPWKRCLRAVERGWVDAVALTSFVVERAAYLRYPPGANAAARARWAVFRLDYMVVVPVGAGYRYDGDPARLPQPVRVPRGWSIGPYLEARGAQVEATASSDENSLRKLYRDGVGSAVVLRETALALLAQPEMTGKLEIDPRPIRSVDYFLGFSRRSSLPDALIEQIWTELARPREATAEPADTKK